MFLVASRDKLWPRAVMRHSEFPSQVCSVARSLEIVGEWWTLLIVREAFFGTQRFSDFETHLGIAKNVLTDRLNTLVDAGVMLRTPVPGRGNPVIYSLTDQGRDLLPVVVALTQWGDRWVNGGKAPVRLLERKTGKEIAPMCVTNSEGARLGALDLVIVPGPGADATIKKRLGRKDD
jgi:DNA-binding HxlR family transcriptional regulator